MAANVLILPGMTRQGVYTQWRVGGGGGGGGGGGAEGAYAPPNKPTQNMSIIIVRRTDCHARMRHKSAYRLIGGRSTNTSSASYSIQY